MPSTHPQCSHSARVDVVVIDDEDSIRDSCRQTLESEGYRVSVAAKGMEGLDLLKSARPRVVILDLRMPGFSGLEVLKKLPGIDPQVIPIIITGYGTIGVAVETMKLGAFDFLTKPLDVDRLLGAVEQGLRKYEGLLPEMAVPKPPPSEVSRPSEPDILLKGLETLGQYYSLGLHDHTLAGELRALEAEAQYHSKVLGQIREKEKAIADLLADLRLVDEVIERHGFRKSALIQILLDIQGTRNWLPRHTLLWVWRRLNIPLAQIYQIAQFYEAFSLKPQGRHIVQVCMGTACHVQKAPEFLATVSALLGIKEGETDSKLLFTLKTAHCFGCCALAPVMRIDETYHRNQPLRQLKAIFSSYGGERASHKEIEQVRP
jgi:NADH-quinone oxidoreductase subunit E